eukprot:TRINITY_DN8351_c1_g3_i1.p1 TRINITY_DN8351_c1_g3~~TRINITY_DN8351_c1_g3_i1.p1  ORF type:complete len:1793 (+),score=620.71 TRINITY_DN8351_c1_g3_i1:83-5461(+)
MLPRHALALLAVLAHARCINGNEAATTEDGTQHKRVISYAAEDATDPVLFIAFTLIVGAVIQLMIARMPSHYPRPPYTVVLFLIGLGLGALTDAGKLKILGHSVNGMVNMDPHLLLYSFLPPLLFESAFAMTPHVFVKSLPQALILAVPGVLISTGFTGILCKLWFNYGWTWSLAFMFGSMVSATDPVAVVALLSELSAPKPLSTVIEAESLLNDGSAFVLYLILKDFAVHNPSTPDEVFVTFCRLALGGPALGFAIGYGFHKFILRFCINDPTVEISVTVTSAYIAFWIAETTSLKSSGVLTVVSLGVYMGAFGKQSISPEVHEFLHHVWHFLGHVANTIIFVLSGAFSYTLISDEHIENIDWAYLVLLYLIVHLARGLTIICLWPAISGLGYGMSVPRGIILWFGGLRGAIALVLSLLVSHEEGIEEINRTRIQFLVAGLVALTIGINGTFAGYLYAKLGLAESTKGHRATLKLSVDYVENNSDTLAIKMKALDFWGKLVQSDIQAEVEKLSTYRPHKSSGGKVEAKLSENEKLKRMVVQWFERQPEHAGRRIGRVTYAEVVERNVFHAQFTHMPEMGGAWPPPIPNLKAREDATIVFYQFTFADDVIETAKQIPGMTMDRYSRVGRLVNKKLYWYPDFSHIMSKGKPSFLQKLLHDDVYEELSHRPLLHDVREDLRRIIIVSVQHRYDTWNEKRIISSDVYGILEEATLFVEDEDLLWVSKSSDYTWEIRGRYDLKSEFARILESLGLCEGGELNFAKDKAHNDGDYWSNRRDLLGKVAAVGVKGLELILGKESVTRAYLHHKLRNAIQTLMFYKAAHQQAWQSIQDMWGALIEGDDNVKTMQEEEDDLNWCYEQADRLIKNIADTIPDTRGMIAYVNEDFIHRLLVVQMTESTERCVHAGLLTDGDSEQMLTVIRNKLKRFFDNQILGDPAKRMDHLIKRSREETMLPDVKLPEWSTLEHLMHEMEHTSIINKRTFWEIKFISDLQVMSTRDKHHNDSVIEEPPQFVMIDGEQRAGSVYGLADQASPFHSLVLTKNKMIHMSQMSTDEDDTLDIDDAVCIKNSRLHKYRDSGEKWCLTCPYNVHLEPGLIKQLIIAEQCGVSRKGWIRDMRLNSGKAEALVYCSLVNTSSQLSWFPMMSLTRCPNFLFEDCLQKSNVRAKNRLLWAFRQVWFRAVVDRVRQQLADKFPYLVSQSWLDAKMVHNEYIGTPWPWWGCIVSEEVVYTERGPDGSPDWSKEQAGLLLTCRIETHYGPMALVRNKYTQHVVEVPLDCHKPVEDLYLESHYGELGLLPSSSYVPFVVGGTEYPTTDHYYQSSKFPDINDEYREDRLEYRRKIIEARTAAAATELGQSRDSPAIAANWDDIRDEVMMTGIRAKFTLNHGVGKHHEQLLSTGQKRLLVVDKNEVRYDRHWTVRRNKEGALEGENIYGKLLMLMRSEVRNELVVEPYVVAALAVVMVHLSLKGQMVYHVGEHVLVREIQSDPWRHGTVSMVNPISGRVFVLADGTPEPMKWKYLQPCLEVRVFCGECNELVKGVSNSIDQCSHCKSEIVMPSVTHFYGYKWVSLAPSSAVIPAMKEDGEVFHSTDHYYQAHKFPVGSELRETIVKAPTHLEALKLGQDRTANPPMREDWEAEADTGGTPERYVRIVKALDEKLQVRTKVMIDAIRLKFSLKNGIRQHHVALLQTGHTYLLLDDKEDNMSAIYWGTGPNNTGLNMYGQLLMAAREELRDDLCTRFIALAACTGVIQVYKQHTDAPDHAFKTPASYYHRPASKTEAEESPPIEPLDLDL